MDSLRLRPSLLAARPGTAAAAPPPALPRRGHFLPPLCSIHPNGKGLDSLSSQRAQGLTLDQYQKLFGWKSSYHRIPHRPTASSADASGQPFHSGAEARDSASIWKPISSSLDAFYRFSRPHTVIGTALSIVSVSLLAVESLSDMSPLFLTGLLEAVVAALFMNIYIVGLNQLFDIEIDKVNKPTLPLASGEYSPATGVALVSAFAVMSFGLGWAVGSRPLFLALFISFILGTAYSINLPFLRWKRSAVVAALCILAVRAVIVQLAFFLHIQTFVFGRPAVFSRPLIFATAFMTFFSVVIALFKDIPDIEGDRIFGIRSFSVRLGQKKVFWICVGLLEMAYCVAILMGATSACLWSRYATVLGHAVLAAILWNRSRSLDLTSKTAITSFYMFIWKLFYAEYLLIPLVR
ncbi:probable homogentisate phytyltransferase 1, chloroplastic [Oryza brachyantha]|nr:probable homogentisate phytyltransferase 1, chloroplastic [Oryza brachyantha]XP_040381494.1 probable homogentisate phytyltransferase 1, chloroplastic [Oryza brachyantha]XP_040381495.1 probable homogentisate phytyltransferase 1, chloroplastic [Oryza brachyantha]